MRVPWTPAPRSSIHGSRTRHPTRSEDRLEEVGSHRALRPAGSQASVGSRQEGRVRSWRPEGRHARGL